jgi:predicted molibdopterin-dependent oxidoreductase YjgC
MVKVDGKLVRACATRAAEGMSVNTSSPRADAAQREAFDRILGNHLLYCTVCDNNNGNCIVHNTTSLLRIEHQKLFYQPKPYEANTSNPFYRYDPDQCILCGRCVQACQTLQVNETLSINWEDPHPRVLWDGGAPIGESSCVSCGHCVTVRPCTPGSSIFLTARLRSFHPWSEPTDQQDSEFDLHLNKGRLLEHFHEGNMTYRTEGIREKTPCTFVEGSPELADTRGIQTGSWVQLTSRYGKVRAQAVITSRVHGNELYMPMNSVEEPLDRLTSSHTDKVTHTPASKETSVQMRVLGEIGDDPLPRTNSRYGHPTPQTGVEVERKWKRKDYRQPGDQLAQIRT